MFLNESYNVNTRNIDGLNISADPVCGLQICLEAEQAWHKMEMQMIKLEHSAIINNDRLLLEEGEKGFTDKIKGWFKSVANTFLRYIDTVINKWREINMKLRSKLIDIEKWKKNILSNLDHINKEISIDVEMIKFGANVAAKGGEVAEAISKMTVANNQGAANDIMLKVNEKLGINNGSFKNITDSYKTANYGASGQITRGEKKVSPSTLKGDLDDILKFLKEGRAKAVGYLQDIRKAGTKLLNKGMEGENARDPEVVTTVKHEVSLFKGVTNSYIIAINKASTQAFRVFGVLKKDFGDKKANDKQKKDMNDKLDSLNNKVFSDSAIPYNILDSF